MSQQLAGQAMLASISAPVVAAQGNGRGFHRPAHRNPRSRPNASTYVPCHSGLIDGPTLSQLRRLPLGREPVLVAWGGGRDSTAMIIEMIARGEPIDAVLFADVGSEKPQTYAFIQLFIQWLRDRGILVYIVRNETQRFRNWPYYDTIEENCIANATLPSLAFGGHGCSQKWKIGPQNRWTERWLPAQTAWAVGAKVVKVIGYDCSPADLRRYAEAEGHRDPRFRYRYLLREWGWTLEDCIRCIQRAGLPVPPKSACFFCPSMKPWEVDELERGQWLRIVLIEACAKPYLTKIAGLWRNGTKGTRGGIPKPGSMTEYIRDRGLLSPAEIDRVVALAPAARLRRKQHTGRVPEQWRALLSALAGGDFHVEGMPDLFTRLTPQGGILVRDTAANDDRMERQLQLAI